MRFVFTPGALAIACTSVAAFAYNPGTSTASVAGQNGPVTVEVKTFADKILSVKVLS